MPLAIFLLFVLVAHNFFVESRLRKLEHLVAGMELTNSGRVIDVKR